MLCEIQHYIVCRLVQSSSLKMIFNAIGFQTELKLYLCECSLGEYRSFFHKAIQFGQSLILQARKIESFGRRQYEI